MSDAAETDYGGSDLGASDYGDFDLEQSEYEALEEIAVAAESPNQKRTLGSSSQGQDLVVKEEDLVVKEEAPSSVTAVAAGAPSLKRKIESSSQELSNKRPAVNVEVARYPATSAIAVAALNTHFKLPAFRLQQESVIARILAGGSAVVVFPTGAGKSICYQIPAITFAEVDQSRGTDDGGITLVVSPLIALMKDQVDALLRRGIKAAVLDSTRTREEYMDTVNAMKTGQLKLLYCAPERLNNEGFIEQMKNVRGGIRLVAVDEAHCISEWGHAFRPDYLKVARFVREIKAERVVCLTATAIPQVAQDICDAFEIDSAGLFRSSSYRPNLQLLAESGPDKQSLYERLFAFLRANPGPTIVYVTLQKQTEVLAEDLRNQRFKAKAFHAGMSSAAKMALQDEFMAHENLIIVATIAFGMGIDKSNIRNVIHFNIPSSIESYSQEIGRAGRDGKISKCLFFVCGDDLHLREIFARGDLPSRESVQRLLGEICNPINASLKVGETIQASLYEQSRVYDIRPTTLSNIYAQLELHFGLFRAITPMYTKYSYKPGPSVNIMSSDKSPAALAIKSYATTAKIITSVDITAASAGRNLPRADLVRKLNEWNDARAIELTTAGVLNIYRITKQLPSTPSDVKAISRELYAELESREQKDLNRTDEMLNLITGSKCFAKSLAQHFGDDLPDPTNNECGHCTWCMTHKAVEMATPASKPFDMAAFDKVLEATDVRDDARLLARVAFGISSPRTTALGLGGNAVFGSMSECGFMDLVRRFEAVCCRVAQGSLPAPGSQPKTPESSRKRATSSSRGRSPSRARGRSPARARNTYTRTLSGGSRGAGGGSRDGWRGNRDRDMPLGASFCTHGEGGRMARDWYGR